MGADDFDATTAELYGWINRAVPDDDFENFVDRFARRIAGFDKFPLASAKNHVNQRAGPPNHADLRLSKELFAQCVQQTKTQQRFKALLTAGLQQDGDTELRFGEVLSQMHTDWRTPTSE